MTLKLIPDSDPVLHTKCEVFNPRFPDFPLQNVLDEMFVLMKEKNGMGLAAPQVGINKRFFIMEFDGQKIVCINPVIIRADKETKFLEEGCLSYPGTHVRVERSTKIRVSFLDRNGIKKTTTLHGIKARCFQHELDHLNGIVFLDRGEKESGGVQHN